MFARRGPSSRRNQKKILAAGFKEERWRLVGFKIDCEPNRRHNRDYNRTPPKDGFGVTFEQSEWPNPKNDDFDLTCNVVRRRIEPLHKESDVASTTLRSQMSRR